MQPFSLVANSGTYSIGRSDGLSFEAAVAVFGFVRVARLGVDTVIGLDVQVGVVHQSPVAAVIAETTRAVDEVLCREANEIAGFDRVLAFERASGRERPA